MERSYIVEVDGAEWQIAIRESPEGLRIRINDEPEQAVDYILAQIPALYSLLLNGESSQARVVPSADEPAMWHVTLSGYHLDARVQTERERRLSRVTLGKQAHTGEVTIKAPMPGLVRAVTVGVGDTVEQGQRLVLLEAMKMENEIHAPRAGTVKAVRVTPGETVENGRPLVVIE
ncbi:MAG TPA: biotin/lipoyl-containing protein [Chloroflexia bacterium]|jgi:biotin carboxyl carrier protein